MPVDVEQERNGNEALARLGATLVEEVLIAAALSGNERVSLQVRIGAGDSSGTLRIGVERTGREPLEVMVRLSPAGL